MNIDQIPSPRWRGEAENQYEEERRLRREDLGGVMKERRVRPVEIGHRQTRKM